MCVCVCTFLCVCACACVVVCLCACMHTHMHIYIYTCTHTRACTDIFTCTHLCLIWLRTRRIAGSNPCYHTYWYGVETVLSHIHISRGQASAIQMHLVDRYIYRGLSPSSHKHNYISTYRSTPMYGVDPHLSFIHIYIYIHTYMGSSSSTTDTNTYLYMRSRPHMQVYICVYDNRGSAPYVNVYLYV